MNEENIAKVQALLSEWNPIRKQELSQSDFFESKGYFHT